MPSEPRELAEAREQLAEFEAAMDRPDGIPPLSDALALLADLRDGEAGGRDAQIASNIARAYEKKVLREVERLAREHIVHIDTVVHWLNVLETFESAGFVLSPETATARSTLALKKMSPAERQALLERQQEMDREEKPG